MKLFELYNYINKFSNLSDKEFLKIFYNNILNDGDTNPFDCLKEDTIQRIYKGQNPVCLSNAKKILSINYELFKDFLSLYIPDSNYKFVSIDLNESFSLNSVPTIDSISTELYQLLIKLTKSIIDKPVNIPKIKRKRESLANIKIENSKIYEGNKLIGKINNIDFNQNNLFENLPYVEQLLLSYADAENIDEISEEILESLDPIYKEDFYEQKLNFYKSQYMYKILYEVEKNSLNDINILKDEILTAVKPKTRLTYKNAFEKMTEITTEATRTNLSGSLISRNTDLLGNKEKKGICHDLVNDKKLWWVKKNEE